MAAINDHRLKAAIKALKNNHNSQARKLLLAEVKENPSNLTAWTWALEVAANEKEKRTILKKILSLDPNHQGAIRYLNKLNQLPEERIEGSTPDISTVKPDSAQEKTRKPSRLGGLIMLFLEWLISLPLSCGLILLLAVIGIGGYLYFRANTSFFGLVGTDFDNLTITNAYEKIAADDIYWEVQFESQGESKFIGTVRHVSPIRIDEFRILTHDILVTTGDYENPDLVDTSVINHKFIWKASNPEKPTGSINLIHSVPATKKIYQELLSIQPWDIVKITGREIYNIKAYEMDGTFLGTWIDTGCNSLLVESVTILKIRSPE